MDIVSATITRVEKIVVISFPGDPELVKLLTGNGTQWTLDWRDGGLHGNTTNAPRRYCLKRTVPVDNEADSSKLIEDLKKLTNS
jgi:hypothetical protein